MLLLFLACEPEPKEDTAPVGSTETDTAPDSGGDTGSDTDTGTALRTWWEDVDNDGFGNPARPVEAASQPEGTADNDLDCNDLDANIRPDATEVCNRTDDDCDSLVDDDDDSLDPASRSTWYEDHDGDGHIGLDYRVEACRPPAGGGPEAAADDCDDDNDAVNPDAEEVCDNGLDDDCDGGAGGCRIGAGTWADADALYLGAEDGVWAGFAIALADVNADGGTDLLYGMPYADAVYTNGGEVVGFTTPGSGNLPYSAAFGSVAVTGAGFSEAELGSALAAIGDVTGDGIGDFVAGAPGYGSFPGAWAVFAGGASFPTAAWTTGVGSGSDDCGYAVAGGGDLNGDGTLDWVVGCPGRGWGEVEVHTGVGSVETIEASANGELGGALAIDDFDGDGLHDLAVGDLDDERVYWFAGPITSGTQAALSDGEGPGGAGDGCIAAVGDPNDDGYPDLMTGGTHEADARYYAGSSGDLLASSITLSQEVNAIAGGDLDGDGVDDIAIGNEATDTVELYYGPVGSSFSRGAWLTITGNGNEGFGRSLAIGDVSQDGVNDLLVGADQNAVAALNAGAVYLFEGVSF